MTTEEPRAQLTVEGSVLATALRPLVKRTGLGRKIVTFEFREGKALIGFDEMRVAIPAVGVWLGVASVSRAFVRTMAKFELEKLSTIQIGYHEGRLTIAGRSHECKWIEP